MKYPNEFPSIEDAKALSQSAQAEVAECGIDRLRELNEERDGQRFRGEEQSSDDESRALESYLRDLFTAPHPGHEAHAPPMPGAFAYRGFIPGVQC